MKDSSGGSSGGYAVMCVDDVKSPVEDDTEQLKSEVNSEVNLEEKNSEEHLEAQLEQSLSLQDWIDSKHKLCANEYILCMNEV